MEYNSITVSEDAGLARIKFNKPPLNILNIAMMREINTALEGFRDSNDLKAIVLEAEGKAFSAGVDVGEHMGDTVEEMIEVFHGIFHRLNEIEVPTVALVKGGAFGGGCEVATYCDLVLASDRAKFGQPEIQVGVFPPIAALAFPRMMHMKKALELILTGEIITAQEAKTLGFVNHVFPQEAFAAEAEKLLGKLTGLSATVLKFAKKATFEGAACIPSTEALEKIEDIYLNELMKTEDANEGLTAFLEKRKPVWKNR